MLEVPLRLCISDVGSDLWNETALEGAAPSWASSLPPDVQLTIAVLERQLRKEGESDPVLDSWPEKPPPLLMTATAEDFELACDPSAKVKAQKDLCYVVNQYQKARAALAASQGVPDSEVDFPSLEAFCSTIAFVWSRSYSMDTGEYGPRRLLVPAVDLANRVDQNKCSPIASCR